MLIEIFTEQAADEPDIQETKLNGALTIVHSWSETHKLTMSINEMKDMIFGPNILRNPSIRLGNSNIKRVHSIKYLDLFVDEKLKFQLHIQNMVR